MNMSVTQLHIQKVYAGSDPYTTQSKNGYVGILLERLYFATTHIQSLRK